MQSQPFTTQPNKMTLNDLFLSILFDLCGIAILIGFFAMPFIQLDLKMRVNWGISSDNLTAFSLISELTGDYSIGDVFSQLQRGNFDQVFDLPYILPSYALYVFVIVAILFFLRSIGALMRFILQNPALQDTFQGFVKRQKRINFFAGLIRIITAPLIFAGIPIAVLGFFYLTVVDINYTAFQLSNLTNINQLGAIFNIEQIQNLIAQYPPHIGMLLMVGGCVAGTLLIILSTIGGMFKRTVPRLPRQPYLPPSQTSEPKPAVGAYDVPHPTQKDQYSPKQPLPRQKDPINWGEGQRKSDL